MTMHLPSQVRGQAMTASPHGRCAVRDLHKVHLTGASPLPTITDMRVIRLAMAVLLSLALTFSPVAAGIAQAHVVKCEQMAMGTQPDDCGCCGEATGCPPSACAAQCSTMQAAFAAVAVFTLLPHEKLGIGPSQLVHSLTFPPDPPPPRS